MAPSTVYHDLIRALIYLALTRKGRDLKWKYELQDQTDMPALKKTLKQKIQIKAQRIRRFYCHKSLFFVRITFIAIYRLKFFIMKA